MFDSADSSIVCVNIILDLIIPSQPNFRGGGRIVGMINSFKHRRSIGIIDQKFIIERYKCSSRIGSIGFFNVKGTEVKVSLAVGFLVHEPPIHFPATTV